MCVKIVETTHFLTLTRQVEKGKILSDFKESLVKKCCWDAHSLTWNGKRVRVLNTPTFHSEVGHELAVKPNTDVGMVWHYNHAEKNFKVSLRSNDDKHDVSILAKQYGGGGHPRAAGFHWAGPTIESLLESGLPPSVGADKVIQ